MRNSPNRVGTPPAPLKTPRTSADTEGDVTRRILSTALVSAVAAAALLGLPARADDPTPTATASTAPVVAETATPAATQAPTEAPTQAPVAPPETATPDAPTSTPEPADTPAPTETATPEAPTATDTDATAATSTATTPPVKGNGTVAVGTKAVTKKRAANHSKTKTGKVEPKPSTSTSTSGSTSTTAPTTTTAPVAPKLTNANGTPATSNPSYALSARGPAKVGVPNFSIDKSRIPPFLLPIYQAAGMQYGIRWEILAGIN